MENNNFVIVQSEVLTKILKKIDFIEQKILELNRKNEKELLTYKDVQRFLKCGRAKVESLVSGGAFKKIQTGGKKSKVLFKRLEIEDYLKKQRDNDFEALQGSKIVNINSVGGC
ncbi:helix-turn-helix domain-containing protein [uncultured Capnocytophaga sp.]|uniref:helix-turn-helix domain-containing protein n=1 Tax=uncultured Capnocytophaga sp. TaxID=159273 RepID=UPI002634C8DD|nr:helix-turn-helix domain-containing protein [uncultured Capnocytophaga sp.]